MRAPFVDEAGTGAAQATFVLTTRNERGAEKEDRASGGLTFPMVPHGWYTMRAEWAQICQHQIELSVGDPGERPSSGCTEHIAARALPRQTNDYYKIKVFDCYGQGRDGHTEPANFYGKRERPQRGRFTCTVSVSFRETTAGELEAPSIWRLAFHEDPEKHVVLLGGNGKRRASLYSDLDSTIAASPNQEV